MPDPVPPSANRKPLPEIVSCPRCQARYRSAGVGPGARITCVKCGEAFAPGVTPQANPVLTAATQISAPPAAAAPAPVAPILPPPLDVSDQTPIRGSPVPLMPQTVDDVLRMANGPGKYDDAEEIARGGMGVILRVTDRAVRRDVAMKVMRNDTNAVQRARFLEEAQVTGQLEHPNIVPIHELGVDTRGRMYFTMKLVKGRSLAELIDEMRKDPTLIDREHSLTYLLSAFTSVCNAVDFAHSKGVIHRDLKPANIMIGGFGEVMLMDWGLAKVGAMRRADRADHAESTVEAEPVQVADTGFADPISSFRNDSEAERTIEGVIAGTPVYMSPEQARGQISAVDARSDIYSLGAILYELLTLHQPVRGKNVEEILKKVRAGAIRPPDKVKGDRPVPRELSAIVMKALATSPKQRYQTVSDLIRDLDLYREGRAVSAKEDAPWETVVKLLKRNRTATAVGASALLAIIVLVAIGFSLNLAERHNAEQALADFKGEQEHRRTDQVKSAPAWLEKAQRSIDHKDFDGARLDVDQALACNPELPRGYQLLAKILIRAQDYAAAAVALDHYLSFQADDTGALKLKEMCVERPLPSSETNRRFADQFLALGDSSFAEAMMESSEGLLKAYRQRLEQAWPGTGAGLSLESDGTCSLVINDRQLSDLAPLRGMPLSRLELSGSKVADIQPLADMPLRRLRLVDSRIRDLSPLKDKSITELTLSISEITSIAALAGMPLTRLDLSGSPVRDIAALKGMALTDLDLSRTKAEDFTVLKGMPLASLKLNGLSLSDLATLKGLHLSTLSLKDTGISDLAPLKGMPLTTLSLSNSKVFDPTPLRGMQIKHLFIDSTPIADLSPLLGIPLVQLDISNTKVTHLASIAGLPLERLALSRTQIKDLAPLKGMRLTMLHLDRVPVSDLSPLKGMPITWLVLSGTQVSDLTPLREMPLERLVLPHQPPIRGLELLKAISSLREIGLDPDSYTGAAVFWKTYGAAASGAK